MDEFYRAIRLLPSWLAEPLSRVPSALAAQIHELRLRTGCGVCLTISGRQCTAETLPECPASLRGLRLTPLQMEEIFHTLSGGSVHTHQAELAQGFLTAPGGCRVGAAGRFTERDGQLILQQVTSLNFRIARAIPVELPEKLRQLLRGHFIGMLVVGEPDSGKTTLLRQIALELAKAHCAVAVLDERGELFPVHAGAPAAADVLSGVPKASAIQMALRTLSPQVVLLDELGSLDETRALEQGFFSGVDFIASVHAADAQDALSRPQVQYLQQHGMLHVLVTLRGRTMPGQIERIQVMA